MKHIINSIQFKISKFLFYFVTFFILSCQPEDSIKHVKHSNDLVISSSANFLEFEYLCNQTLTSNDIRPVVPMIFSIPFTHIDGVIEETEKSRILNEISLIEYSGPGPFVIDVNLRANLVEVVYDNGMGTEDPNPYDFDCYTYQERYNDATDCGPTGTDYFNGMNNLKANGGINGNGNITPGQFCDDSGDSGGGGNGRVSIAFIQNNPLPDWHLHWQDIREFNLIGDEQIAVYDEWNSSHFIEVLHTKMWFYSSIDPIGPLCMDNSDLNEYYCNLYDLIEEYLPENYYIISYRVASFNVFGIPPDDEYYWLHSFKVGKSVQCCCECC